MRFMLWLNAFFATSLLAQSNPPLDSTANTEDTSYQYNLNLDYPVIESPFNFANNGAFPSMQQSLVITKAFYRFSHLGLGHLKNPNSAGALDRFLGRMLIIFFDILSEPIPPSYTWLHEEWHRAVMSQHSIDSYNGVYDFGNGNSIPVRKVKDDDLIQLKKDHPEDQVRLSEVCIESQYELSLAFEKDMFFHDTRSWDLGQILLNYIGASSYLGLCASNAADGATKDSEDEEGSNIPKRDFTGLDCVGWAYDLYRPDEPYQARGVHPSGVGIRRYRRFEDLTNDEKSYLRKQRDLSFLNYLDPFVIGFRGFQWGDWVWNSTLRHHMTSFGSSTDLNLFLKSTDHGQYLVIFHAYAGKARVFPGLELQVIDAPVRLGGTSLLLSPRLMVWQQPKHQRFASKEGEPGGLASLRISNLIENKLSPFVELEGKTRGWVAGNAYTSRSFAARLGVIWNRL